MLSCISSGNEDKAANNEWQKNALNQLKTWEVVYDELFEGNSYRIIGLLAPPNTPISFAYHLSVFDQKHS
jgi:hypothetical protein